MNYFKLFLQKLEGLYQTPVIITSIMIFSIFFCGSCDLFNDIAGIVEPDDYEPNNSIAAAHAIDKGATYIAYIAENDADYFSFTTAHGSTTFDEVEIDVSDVGTDLLIGIAVYNSDGELVDQNTVSTAGANLSWVLRDLHSDETYYVRFSGTWGTGWTVDEIGDHDSEGSYVFSVTNLNANDEFAGNHSINDAYSIATGQTYDGVLVSKYEADYYSFTPTSENMQLQINNVGSELKVGVALYLPNFELAGNDGPSTAGANFGLNLTSMNTSETYYLRISGTWGTGWTVDGIGDHDSYGPYTFTLIDN